MMQTDGHFAFYGDIFGGRQYSAADVDQTMGQQLRDPLL